MKTTVHWSLNMAKFGDSQKSTFIDSGSQDDAATRPLAKWDDHGPLQWPQRKKNMVELFPCVQWCQTNVGTPSLSHFCNTYITKWFPKNVDDAQCVVFIFFFNDFDFKLLNPHVLRSAQGLCGTVLRSCWIVRGSRWENCQANSGTNGMRIVKV